MKPGGSQRYHDPRLDYVSSDVVYIIATLIYHRFKRKLNWPALIYLVHPALNLDATGGNSSKTALNIFIKVTLHRIWQWVRSALPSNNYIEVNQASRQIQKWNIEYLLQALLFRVRIKMIHITCHVSTKQCSHRFCRCHRVKNIGLDIAMMWR